MAKDADKQETRHRWQPGQSGNPSGRPPKERTLVTHIERYLHMTQEQLKQEAAKLNLTIAQYLAVKYLLDCSTHPTHTDKLMDRLYGAPQTTVDVTTKGASIQAPVIVQVMDLETKELYLHGRRQIGTATEINANIPKELSSVVSGATPGT